MNRRRLLRGLAFAMLAPLAAEAQQAGKVYRVGYLGLGATAPGPHARAFSEALSGLGYVEGKNLVIEYRWAGDRPDHLPALALDLVRLGVDVIVAPGNQPVLAAKAATTTIPIVMPWVLEPVETGIVESLARPAGNVTGLTWEEGTEQGKKKLQLFKELVPTASRMDVVWNPTMPGLARYWPPFRTAATALGMTVNSVEYVGVEDLDRALATVLKHRPSAIFFWADQATDSRRQALCDFAVKNRLPTIAPTRQWTEAGCLISYVTNSLDRFRRAATYVDKIFKGARPADLPVEQPTKFELVINGKTAKALGLTIPQSLLIRADQVIE